MTTLRTGILVAALGAGLAGILAGDAATVGVMQPGSSTRVQHSDWTEVKWPFPLDQWGTGRAFRCSATDCGVEVSVYLRPKIGFCNCAEGVADDAELDRVGDLELFSDKFRGLADGQPITVGWMSGRSRPYNVFGVLFERRVGGARLFINSENLSDVRQTRWDPIVRPARGADGRWTVDGWAPLEGRTFNGGVRWSF